MNADPVSLAEVRISTRDLSEYLAARESERLGAPDGFYALGICRHCGTSLGDRDEDKVIQIGSFGFLPNVCCPACAQAGKDRLAEEDRKARQLRFYAGNIPDEFFEWKESIGNNDALAEVRRKFSFSTRRNLVIQGSTGSCKTRIMWELVKTVIEQPDGFTHYWLDSYDAATKGIPDEAHKAAFLFIDDLGNEPTSTKFETALLRLIRNRCDWHKPFVISTQMDSSSFAKRFFQGSAAAAIMRRMKARTDSVLSD